MKFMMLAIVALASFHCMDLLSNDWLPGVVCPIVFVASLLILLVKVTKALGLRTGLGGDGDGNGWLGDSDGSDGDGGGD